MEKLENITTQLKEEIKKETNNLLLLASHNDYANAALAQARIEAYEKAIYIVNTLF